MIHVRVRVEHDCLNNITTPQIKSGPILKSIPSPSEKLLLYNPPCEKHTPRASKKESTDNRKTERMRSNTLPKTLLSSTTHSPIIPATHIITLTLNSRAIPCHLLKLSHSHHPLREEILYTSGGFCLGETGLLSNFFEGLEISSAGFALP